MLGKVWIIVAHGDHDSGVGGERVPWTVVLDVGAGYDCWGEGFVDGGEDAARDGGLGLSGSMPVLVVDTGAVSVPDEGER